MKLIKKYETICNEIINKFAIKQDLNFEFWTGDTIGEVAVFGDYSFNFTDIIQDLRTNQKKGLILQWQNDTIENHFRKNKYRNNINYRSYCKGLRY